MAENKSLFTQASNFISANKGRFEPRTRLFTFNFHLANLIGNNGRGPSFPLSLFYFPMTTMDFHGLGIGFSLSVSCCNSQQRLLMMKIGGNFRLRPLQGSKVENLQHKLDTVKIEKKLIEGDTAYIITYKTGERECLMSVKEGGINFLTKYIETPPGLRLNFFWDSYCRLLKITNDTKTTLCSFNYENERVNSLTVYPGSEDVKQFSLVKTLYQDNRYITGVENCNIAKAPLEWKLDYSWYDASVRINNKPLLNSVNAPTGLQEKVIYDPQAIKVNSRHGMQYIPGAVQLTTRPGAT